MHWECDFDKGLLADRPDLKLHPVVQHSPLITRDALYGGRIEAMRLHHKVGDGETIQYVDVISLYLYLCKYFKFPIGHPVIHVGDACQDMQAMILKERLMKCSILPSRRLFHLVLPFRCNKRLLFCLCRSCAMEQNRNEDCMHETVAERALTGTWVLDEIRLAVQKGYELVEVHEIYEYRVTQYDPQTCTGGLFVQYIDTFLKVKAEASRYPSWVQGPADEDRYISEFAASEGIQLDKYARGQPR